MSGSYHEVQSGESLSSIAQKYRAGTWKTLYEHPRNAGFRAERQDPNLIYPGDRVYVPGKGDDSMLHHVTHIAEIVRAGIRLSTGYEHAIRVLHCFKEPIEEPPPRSWADVVGHRENEGYHLVLPGECLSSIAEDHGIADWNTLYNAAENAEFRQKRPNPDEIFPGDRIYVGVGRGKYWNEPAFERPKETAEHHEMFGHMPMYYNDISRHPIRLWRDQRDVERPHWVARNSPNTLRFQTNLDFTLYYEDGEPMSNMEFEVSTDDTTSRGRTDAEGRGHKVLDDAPSCILYLLEE